jgi:hypothetical protein
VADFIATRRELQATNRQIAADQKHLRGLLIKLVDTLRTLQRANVAYCDSLRFVSPSTALLRTEDDPLSPDAERLVAEAHEIPDRLRDRLVAVRED